MILDYSYIIVGKKQIKQILRILYSYGYCWRFVTTTDEEFIEELYNLCETKIVITTYENNLLVAYYTDNVDRIERCSSRKELNVNSILREYKLKRILK